MNVFLILFAMILAFTLGTISGFVLGADTMQIPQKVCDSCDCKVEAKDAVFCEDCFEEDDKLTAAINEKEMDIRYKNMTLRGRGILNKPESAELEKLRLETEKIDTLCSNVDNISKDLDLKTNVEQLKERNASLKKSVEKWNDIIKREGKLDEILKNGKEEKEEENDFSIFSSKNRFDFQKEIEDMASKVSKGF